MENTNVKRVMDLMNEGKTMPEALEIVLAEQAKVVSTSGKVDRIALANSFVSIADVDDAIHKAHAKKSKSEVGSAARGRYEHELEVLKAKRNELLARVNTAEDPIRAAMELGKSDKAIVQMFLQANKEKIEASLQKIKASNKLSNVKIKEETNKQDIATPESVTAELTKYRASLAQEYLKQQEAGNQWVITTNRQLRLIAQYLKREEEIDSKVAAVLEASK